jgi:enediyne polyketide synthase
VVEDPLDKNRRARKPSRRCPPSLKALITYGSIIAQSGMHGECDYALANEELARDGRVSRGPPRDFALCLEWTLVRHGMGETSASSISSRLPASPDRHDEGLGMLERAIETTRRCPRV